MHAPAASASREGPRCSHSAGPGGPEGCRAQSQASLNKVPQTTMLLVPQGLLRQKDFGRKVTLGLELSGALQWRFVPGFAAKAAQ